MYALSKGDISLENVTANDSVFGYGASLDNTASTSNAGIKVTGTSEFNGSSGWGLSAYSNGNVTLENITADDDGIGLWITTGGDIEAENISANKNSGSGSIFDNRSGSGSITLAGTNVFNENGTFGLEAYSNGNITLNNVTASDNKTANGVLLQNDGGTGNVTLTGSNTFNGNTVGTGLEVISKGTIITNNLTAGMNGLYGAYLQSSGSTPKNITLNGTNLFHDNSGGFGLVALTSGGSITVNNVTAYNQTTGLYLDPPVTLPSNITINCGNIYNNGTGIDAYLSGTLTFNGVTFNNNLGNFFNNGGTLVENPNYCKSAKQIAVVYSSKPINEVSASGGVVELNCVEYKGTHLNLSNGNFVYLPCPLQGSVSLSSFQPENLPDGFIPHSGFTAGVTENGEERDMLDTYITLSFEIPAGVDVTSLSILYFDGSEWVELSNDLDLGNGKQVGLGGYISVDGLYFQATVNFIGDFVLVSAE